MSLEGNFIQLIQKNVNLFQGIFENISISFSISANRFSFSFFKFKILFSTSLLSAFELKSAYNNTFDALGFFVARMSSKILSHSLFFHH